MKKNIQKKELPKREFIKHPNFVELDGVKHRYKDVQQLRKEQNAMRIENLAKQLLTFIESDGDEVEYARLNMAWRKICDEIFEAPEKVGQLIDVGFIGMSQVASSFFATASIPKPPSELEPTTNNSAKPTGQG